jgi:hypothetical protein
MAIKQMAIVGQVLLPLLLIAADSQEEGKRVIDEAIAALGGNNFLHMQDRVESGRAYSFYNNRLSGLSFATIYTRYLIRPEPPAPAFFGIRERQTFGKKRDSSVILTETEAYNVNYHGAYPLPTDQLDRFRETTLRNVFYILRERLGEPGLTFESKGRDVIDNQPVEIVDIIDNDNRVVTVYFQLSTHLPVRQVTDRRPGPGQEPIQEVSRFTKYREVTGGIMWPFAIERERNGEKIYVMYSEHVEINKGLADNLFTLPANVEIMNEDGKPRSKK